MSESGEVSEMDNGKVQDELHLHANMSEFGAVPEMDDGKVEEESDLQGTYPDLTSSRIQVIIQPRQLAKQFVTGHVLDGNTPRLRDRIVSFTDGSYFPDSDVGGAAVTSQRLPASPRWIDGYRGIVGAGGPYVTELVAIILALQFARSEVENIQGDCLQHKDPTTPLPDLYIFTDSQRVLEDIEAYLQSPPAGSIRQDRWFTYPVFQKVLYGFHRLACFNMKIQLHWVKGHDGVHGNCRADHLAKDASRWVNSHPLEYAVNGAAFNITRLPTRKTMREERQKILAKEGMRKRKAEEMSADSEAPEENPTHRDQVRHQKKTRRETEEKLGKMGLNGLLQSPVRVDSRQGPVGKDMG